MTSTKQSCWYPPRHHDPTTRAPRCCTLAYLAQIPALTSGAMLLGGRDGNQVPRLCPSAKTFMTIGQ
eukprot:1133028-Rhodomonas_salina.2